MKRLMLLTCLLIGSLAWPTLGQDGSEPAPSPAKEARAIAVFHAPGEFKADDARAATARLREAVGALTDFRSLDDAQSLSDLVRLLLTASSIGPGVTVAVLDVVADADDPQRTAGLRVIARLHGERTDDLSPQVGGFSAGDSVVFVSYADAVTTIWFDTTGNTKEHDIADSLAAFADHRKGVESGLELMLDLENLRRAWPQSLADGPARRVVAVTGLANARKVHVHLPERGPARIAYSSRALPAGEVSTRSGPAPVGDARVGVRWPVMFDAGLRVYVVGLGDEPRRAFASSFQQWMGVHGNRLRGVIQALDAGVSWSVTRTEGGLRTSVEIPVRPGVELDALLEAVAAALTGSGFAVEGDGGTLTLPQTLGAAMGGGVLTVTLERAGGEGDEGGEGGQPAARFVLVIE
jgi:hypothetical protein